VPRDVIEKATAAGYQQIRYVRAFDALAGGERESAFVTLNIQGAPREITVSPKRAGVGYGLETILPLQWTLRLSPSDGNVLVRSEEGMFLDKRGRRIGRSVSTLLSRKDSDKVVFQESLTIPAEVVSDAAGRGFSSFVYVRAFTVGGASLEGEVVLNIDSGIDTVSVSPARVKANVGRDSVATVRWKVITRSGPVLSKAARKGSRKAGGLTVSSGQGLFRTLSGEIIGKNRKGLATTMSGGKAEISERVIIPKSVVDAAAARRQSRFLYTREYSDGFGSAAGDLVIDLAGRIGGEFAIDRLSLTFQDNSLVKVVNSDEELTAIAEITFTGSGLLIGRWLIAEPPSTAGRRFDGGVVSEREIFTILRHVVLPLAGQRKVRISSPKLPTGISGLYAVRFRIERPGVGDEAPTLIYEVNPFSVGMIPMGPEGPSGIRIISPRGRTGLAPGVTFSWERIPGSIAYQLEVFDGPEPPQSVRVTGQVVPGDLTELTLSHLAGEDLTAGASYWWRVVAFGPGGGVTGVSRLLPINAP
jgi:hypothetical protein